MTPEPEPPCECTAPGFCPRYQIHQAEQHLKLCRESPGFRRKWREKLAGKSKGGPSIIRKAVNAAGALVRNAKTGFRRVPLEVLSAREAHCAACEFNDKDKGICTHPTCGCCVVKNLLPGLKWPSKLELAAEKCPMGKWLPEA